MVLCQGITNTHYQKKSGEWECEQLCQSDMLRSGSHSVVIIACFKKKRMDQWAISHDKWTQGMVLSHNIIPVFPSPNYQPTFKAAEKMPLQWRVPLKNVCRCVTIYQKKFPLSSTGWLAHCWFIWRHWEWPGTCLFLKTACSFGGLNTVSRTLKKWKPHPIMERKVA